MSLVYVAKLALSAILPSSAAAVTAASTGLSATLPVIADDLAGAATLSAQITITPPDLTAEIATTAAIIAGLTAGVSLSLPLVDFQVFELGAQIAQLAPIVGDLSAAVALTLPLAGLFVEQGVQAWSFAGTSPELGPLLTSALAAGMPDGAPRRAEVSGFILASTAGATWTGMQSFFPSLPGSQPAGSLVPLGGLSIGTLVGLLSSGVTSANVSLNAELGSLGARLDGANAAKAALTSTPPTLLGNIAVAGDLAASLAAYSPGAYITPSVAISAAAALVTSITALQSQVTADVSGLGGITTALATAGVLGFTYAGTAEDLGTAVSSAIASGWPDGTSSSAASNALVLLASSGGTASALSSLFGGL